MGSWRLTTTPPERAGGDRGTQCQRHGQDGAADEDDIRAAHGRRPGPGAFRGPEAARLHRGGQLRAPSDGDHEHRERHRCPAPERAGVAEPAGAPGQSQRTPVVDELRQQAEPGQRSQHEAGGQLPDLCQPVGEVGRVDAGEEQDRGDAEREHPQQHRDGQPQRVVRDVHEEPVDVYGAARSPVQRHVQRGQRRQRQDGPDAAGDERQREAEHQRSDEDQPDHRRPAQPVEGHQEREGDDHGGGDACHRVHPVECRAREGGGHRTTSRWIRFSPSRAR